MQFSRTALTSLALTAAASALAQPVALNRTQIPGGLRDRIVGGERAKKGAYPFMAGLLDAANLDNHAAWFCGASLIDAKHLMTAAHCAVDLPQGGVDVLLGTNDLEAGGRRFRMKRAFVHPDYDSETLENDIAVLELEKKVPFRYRRYVKLPSSPRQSAFGKEALTIGWGSDLPIDVEDPNGQTHYPNWLNQLKVKIDDPQVDAENAEYIGPSTIAAGFRDGDRGVCFGDSGGPLVVPGLIPGTYVQIGINSFVLYGCGLSHYDGYVKVQDYVKFINQVRR